ncbi:phosphotransferase [Nocardia blacklockiae]|nr:phosphotransferase [Nocardia blacklockiae]
MLSDRADGPVLRVGDLVVKAHAADTDPTALRSRLRLATAPRLHDILAPPLPIDGDLLRIVHGRTVTAWPYGVPVDPADPDAAPWEHCATLLARLHRTPLEEATNPAQHRPGTGRHLKNTEAQRVPQIPPAGGPARVRRAIARLRATDHSESPAAAAVLRAYADLPALDADPKTLVHGDFHLGQVVRLPDRALAPGGRQAPGAAGETRWRLIDIDDLGVGDPVWDLARPAAYFAAGILEPLAWQRFLNAYRRCGGPAVPSQGDEWAVLDVPARALVVQSAALAVAKSGARPDDLDTALIDACVRMTTLTYGG